MSLHGGRHGQLSSCQVIADQLTAEINTISGIDIVKSISAKARVATIEAKRAILNAHLDDMIRVIKDQNPTDFAPQE